MKKNLLVLIAAFSGLTASAQKIKVKESSENIGGGSHSALVVTLYEVSPSDAEESFRSFMKKYDGKRSSKDGGIFIDNASIKDMSANTVDIYGKANGKKDDKEIEFIVAFDLGGAFVASSDHKAEYKIAEQIVKDFAVSATKEAIQNQLKIASRLQDDLEGDQKKLEHDQKKLEDDIVDYKDKIKKAEDDISKNKSDQEKKKSEIEAQKKVVDGINTKLKAVE